MNGGKLCVAGIVALGAMFAIGGSASANHIVDSECLEAGRNNEFALFDLSIGTTSPWAYDVTGLSAGGLACGTTLHNNLFNCGTPPIGRDTLNVNADIRLPEGIEVNRTANMADGAYVGSAGGRIAACAGLLSGIFGGTATIRVERDPGTDCPADAIACYRSDADATPSPGYNYVWITSTSAGSYQLNIGPTHTSLPGEAGVTRFSISLCANAGAPEGNTCGQGLQPWLIKNGRPGSTRYCTDADPPQCDWPVDPQGGCASGRFPYSVTVINMRGQRTAPVVQCIGWDCRPAWQANGCRPPGGRSGSRGGGRRAPGPPKSMSGGQGRRAG